MASVLLSNALNKTHEIGLLLGEEIETMQLWAERTGPRLLHMHFLVMCLTPPGLDDGSST